MSKLPRWYPLVTIVYGVILFGWLTPEENRVITVSLLGFGFSVLAGLGSYYRLSHHFRYPAYWLPIWGAMIGGGSAVATILLMFLKTTLHSHLFPDYPLFLMLALWERMPVWVLAGALVGISVDLMR